MSNLPGNNGVKLDDLDNLIISIIQQNNGITASLIHYVILNDFEEEVNPDVIISRLDRLIKFDIIETSVEFFGKYNARQFHYKKHDGRISANGGYQ